MRENRFREKRPEWLALRAVPRKYEQRRVIVKVRNLYISIL
jgi:hypothetical protein